jgi:aspartyl-tRNA(Asn)/glutamyl-tRNA(Gln) amidotransferase subunit B
VPLRKQLKDEAKALRVWREQKDSEATSQLGDWELTVGIEIHAQLDTESKLFSSETTHLHL